MSAVLAAFVKLATLERTMKDRDMLGRIVKFLLGSDDSAFVAAAAGVSLTVGNLITFGIVYLSPAPPSTPWQTAGAALVAGIALGLFLMPFIFMAISRMLPFMNPWEALATITAAMLCPLGMMGLKELGLNSLPAILGCVAIIPAAYFAARAISSR